MSKPLSTRRPLAVGFALVAIFALSALAIPASAEAAAWNADPNHSQVNFAVDHFFTPVTGNFGEFEITLAFDAENPANSSVEAKIAIASIDTGNERRDGHLRSGDFFEAEQHPYMTFKSSSVEKVGENEFVAHGPLTIKGTYKEIELPFTLLGVKQLPEPMQEMFGGVKEVASFKAATTIDRGDFGVGVGDWASDLVIGDEVEIEIYVEANRK